MNPRCNAAALVRTDNTDDTILPVFTRDHPRLFCELPAGHGGEHGCIVGKSRYQVGDWAYWPNRAD